VNNLLETRRVAAILLRLITAADEQVAVHELMQER